MPGDQLTYQQSCFFQARQMTGLYLFFQVSAETAVGNGARSRETARGRRFGQQILPPHSVKGVYSTLYM